MTIASDAEDMNVDIPNDSANIVVGYSQRACQLEKLLPVVLEPSLDG